MEEVPDVDRPRWGDGLNVSDPILLGPDKEDWVPLTRDPDEGLDSEEEEPDDWNELVEEFT
jgi:hypothetical protein